MFSIVDAFPGQHLEASRRDKRLQAEIRELVEEARRANPDVLCPECGSGSGVAWFWFSSPAWTWENLCGRAGVVAYCDEHERQVAYFGYVMTKRAAHSRTSWPGRPAQAFASSCPQR